MAAPGVRVSEVITVESASVKPVAQRIVLAMTQQGDYELASTGRGLLEFHRRYKPTWGLGTMSKTERCTISISKDKGALVVNVDGMLLDERLEAVRAAVIGRSVARAALDTVLGPVDVLPNLDGFEEPVAPRNVVSESKPSPPGNASSSGDPARSKGFAPAPGRSADTDPVLPMPAGDAPLISRIPDGSSTAGGSATLSLELGDGRSIPLDGRIVLGRDPVPPPDAPGSPIPIGDETVSKTHCWIQPSTGGALVCDLHSTNGTAVIDDYGRRVGVDPDSPSLLMPGASVALGDYLIKVVAPGADSL